MNDEIRKNLVDALQAAQEILSFTAGMDHLSYKSKLVTQRAVERDFESLEKRLPE